MGILATIDAFSTAMVKFTIASSLPISEIILVESRMPTCLYFIPFFPFDWTYIFLKKVYQ